MAASNSLNISSSGVVAFDSTTGVFSESVLTQHDVLVGGASNAITSISPSTAGLVLTSNGISSDPSFEINPGSTSTTYVNSSPYNVLATDDVILMDTALFASPMSVVLLSSPTQDGKVWTIKDWSGQAENFNITITVAGGLNIDGSASFVLNENYQSVSICWSTSQNSYSIVYDYESEAIQTIIGDTGSITGNTVTIYAGNAGLTCGSTVEFVNGGTLSTLTVSDSSENTIVGQSSGNLTLTGAQNTIFGFGNAAAITTASDNNFFGHGVAPNLLTGNQNIIVGHITGTSYTGAESGNILLNSTGVLGETNTLRIGQATGTTSKDLQAAFIYGISGVTVSNAQMVTINSSTSQFGSQAIPLPIIPWTDESTSFTGVINNGYYTTATLTATLPASPVQGSVVRIIVIGNPITTIQASGTQQIHIGNSNSSSGGTATNTLKGDSIELFYRATSNIWWAASTVGSWTLA